MTIDHESVPRPGRPLPPSRRVTTELLDRRPPRRPVQARSAPPVGRHRRPFRSRLAHPLGLLTADGLAVCAATVLTATDPQRPLLGAAAVLPLLLPLNLTGGLYRNRLTLSALDELPALAARATVATAFAVTLSACLDGWPDSGPATPLRLLSLVAAFLLLASVGRAFVYHLIRKARRRRPSPVLVLGAGQLGQQVAAALTERREYGLRPVGFLDPDPVLLAEDATLPVLGGREVLEREIRRHRVHHVVATEGAADEAETAAALREAARLGCRVWLVPALREYGAVADRSRGTTSGASPVCSSTAPRCAGTAGPPSGRWTSPPPCSACCWSPRCWPSAPSRSGWTPAPACCSASSAPVWTARSSPC
ncbi:nucleoside-diphosphate sugar epimerase/dehydratase [Kitasatospora gansuensis]